MQFSSVANRPFRQHVTGELAFITRMLSNKMAQHPEDHELGKAVLHVVELVSSIHTRLDTITMAALTVSVESIRALAIEINRDY